MGSASKVRDAAHWGSWAECLEVVRARGIVVGGIFRRLVARTIAQQYAKLGEAATHLFQYALSTKAGTECVTHFVQALTSENPEATILSMDGIGAYDLISPNAIFRGVADMGGGDKMIPFVRLFHGSPSTFHLEDDAGTVHHVGQGGGEQWDPRMPLLFSLGHHRALVNVRSKLEEGEKFFGTSSVLRQGSWTCSGCWKETSTRRLVSACIREDPDLESWWTRASGSCNSHSSSQKGETRGGGVVRRTEVATR